MGSGGRQEGKRGTKGRGGEGREGKAAFRVLVASEMEGDPGSIPGGVTNGQGASLLDCM